MDIFWISCSYTDEFSEIYLLDIILIDLSALLLNLESKFKAWFKLSILSIVEISILSIDVFNSFIASTIVFLFSVVKLLVFPTNVFKFSILESFWFKSFYSV